MTETIETEEQVEAEEQVDAEEQVEQSPKDSGRTRELPLVALRETVIFPEMIVPLQVGRDKSVQALNKAVADSSPIALVTQRQADREDINETSELYTIGTLAKIAQVVQLQDGTVRAIVQGLLADMVAYSPDMTTEQRQELLETIDVHERLKLVSSFLARQVEILELKGKIQSEVKSEMDKTQREYILREQMKAIQKELGEDDPAVAEATELRTKVDWLVSLPWGVETADDLDLSEAEKVLNEDHYGLEKPKERIVEYMAVRKLAEKIRSPILLFVGPPGVGKTSLGKSIARAMGRKFVRMSLGGIHDEAEIRGHRRTYIGALPGRIIQNIKTAGSNNPVFMLDEVDKIGMDFRGDPSSALLEVLDPEQNNTFQDNYLEVPFDLSKVLFVATANLLDPIPA